MSAFLPTDVSALVPPEWVATGLAACRIGGMLLAWPTVGAGVVPWRARIAIALVVGVAVAGTVPASSYVPLSFSVVFGELLGGLLLGLGLRVVLTALQAAGTWIDDQVGTGLAAESVLNESEDNTQGTAQLLVWMGTWLLLTMPLGADMVWIESLRESFAVLPVGTIGSSDRLLALTVAWLRAGSILAIGIAMPICLMQALLHGGLAMLSRSWGIPLGHAMSPLRATVAIALLWVLIPRQAERIEAELGQMRPSEIAAASRENAL